MAQNYRDLIVWQKAIDLVTEIYRLTRDFPKEELYGLTSQIRRSSVSIPSNIAEGQARLTPGEFRQALGYARGSYAELDTQLMIAVKLGYLPSAEPITSRLHEIGRMLNALIASVK